MSTEPTDHLSLSTSSINKLVFFVILMAPAVVLMVGIVPAVLLTYGLVMTLLRSDFSQLKLAVRNCNYLLNAAAILAAITFIVVFCVIVFDNKFDITRWPSRDKDVLFIAGITIIGSIGYKNIIQRFFLAPLTEHKEWLVSFKMPTFKPRTKKIGDRGFRVVVDKPLASAQVIDDIARWEKLKEEGRITKEEFDEIRIKILQRI